MAWSCAITIRPGPAELGTHVWGEEVVGGGRGPIGEGVLHLGRLHRVHGEGCIGTGMVLLRGEDVTEVNGRSVVVVKRGAVGGKLALNHVPLGRS